MDHDADVPGKTVEKDCQIQMCPSVPPRSLSWKTVHTFSKSASSSLRNRFRCGHWTQTAPPTKKSSVITDLLWSIPDINKAVIKLHNDESIYCCVWMWCCGLSLKAEPRVRGAIHADLCSTQQASWITSLSWCICHLPADTATSYKPVSSTSCDLQHGPTTETSPQFSVYSDKTEASWEL